MLVISLFTLIALCHKYVVHQWLVAVAVHRYNLDNGVLLSKVVKGNPAMYLFSKHDTK